MKTKVYNSGGIGRARLAERMDSALECRKLYPASKKLQILYSVDSLMKKETMTQNQASVAMQVCPSQVSRWRACADDLAASLESGRDKLKLNQGPAGLLDDVEEDLVTFVDEWHMKGLPASRLSLVRKACRLSPVFSEKSLPAQKMAISRIMARNNLAHRMSTHAAQHPPEEVSLEALGYLEVIVPIVNDSNRSPEFTANMDQTPMWHAMSQKGSINTIGKHTINVRTSPLVTMVTVDQYNTGINPVVRSRANGQMQGQKNNLARRRTVLFHCVDGEDVLHPPLVPPRHPLMNKLHHAPLLNLVATTSMAAAAPPAVLGEGTHDVDHCVEDAGEGGGTSTDVRSGRLLLRDSWRLLRDGGFLLCNSSRHIRSGQSGKGGLLARIHSRCPRRHCTGRTSHDGISDRALGHAQLAAAALHILVCERAGAALPGNHFGRSHHCGRI